MGVERGVPSHTPTLTTFAGPVAQHTTRRAATATLGTVMCCCFALLFALWTLTLTSGVLSGSGSVEAHAMGAKACYSPYMRYICMCVCVCRIYGRIWQLDSP